MVLRVFHPAAILQAYLYILSFPISNPAIHPACWLPRLQLVTLNFKYLQFSPWWHGEVAGSTSERVVLDTLPAVGVPLERRERRGLECHYNSDVFFLFLWLFWGRSSHLGMCSTTEFNLCLLVNFTILAHVHSKYMECTLNNVSCFDCSYDLFHIRWRQWMFSFWKTRVFSR